MSKALFERIVSSTPIDANAKAVTGSGTHYEPIPGTYTSPWYSECPDLKAISRQQKMTPGFMDHTGKTFGDFRVIGLAAHPTGRAQWVCLCKCGRYQMRKGSAIAYQKPSDYGYCCDVCQNTRRVRDGKESFMAGAR